ncbi:response regulator transcription factor [Kordiimonas sp.]|uniref:response regulator transcription factor n=1 Tax=Kordiimonas sp. TaxID=1970157 RepID=UPI003A9496A2
MKILWTLWVYSPSLRCGEQENVNKSTHIAVLDDHRMFLEGISIMVKNMSDSYRVANFHDPADLLTHLSEGKRFDLIICDLIMDRMNGLAFLAAVKAQTKRLPVLMLSGINTAPPIVEMKKLGARGFIHKSADNDTLSKAVKTVLSGKTLFMHDDAPGQLEGSNEAEDDLSSGQIPVLGKRQIEVLNLIAAGASNKEISRSLTITENTVKTHLKQIFQVFGVNKRTACVRKAQALGIL